MGERGRSWEQAGEWAAGMHKLHEVATNLAAIGLTKQGFTLKIAECAAESVKIAQSAKQSANSSQRTEPGDQTGGQSDHGERRGAAEHHRRHHAKEPRGDPRLEGTELV